MYDNDIIEPYTVIMADNTAYIRIIPDELTVGLWHVEFYSGDDLKPKDDQRGTRSESRLASPTPIFKTEAKLAEVFAFVPWLHMYVPGDKEDSFFHYLFSESEELGFIPTEIKGLVEEVTERLGSDQPFWHEGSVRIRKLMTVGETLRRTLSAGRNMFNDRGIDEDMWDKEIACAEECRKKDEVK